jgi:hypothetical protein
MMKRRLSIDRFDGLRKELAVLLTEDGRSFVFPRDFLPQGAKAGELLSIVIERDLEGTAEVQRRAKVIRDELDQTDPGGDISL